MKMMQKGFTLIELMIVVAIIGILAAIAMPAYENFINKSEFTDAISRAHAYKLGVEMCVTERGFKNVGQCTGGATGLNGRLGNIPPDMTVADTTIASITTKAGVVALTGVAGKFGQAAAVTYILNPTKVAAATNAVAWTQGGNCNTPGTIELCE